MRTAPPRWQSRSRLPSLLARTMSESKPLLDPKELVPAGIGFFLGLGILVFFYLLTTTLGMPTFAELYALPRQ